ncbi:MAG: hypothetical protein H6737_07005 [Alphaproteobacteria bacterium]|nr:hypothetical protein [Alphaproteobacteria bacterium]
MRLSFGLLLALAGCSGGELGTECEVDGDCASGLICEVGICEDPIDCTFFGDNDEDGICNESDLCFGDDSTGDADFDGVCANLDPCFGDDATGDTDADGVCDSDDDCFGDDATGDTDADGICDDRDACVGDDGLGDTDGDGICDDQDDCLGDDTTGDTDGDGVCDDDDLCNGVDATGDDDLDGLCNDIDPCDGDNATGDTDGDGVCNDLDPCPADAPDDSDADGVCNSDDVCPGADDTADADGDGVPDGCDPCPTDSPDDADADTVCDGDDVCPTGDDRYDNDGDGVPDACDPCPLAAADDSDGDGVCDDVDACPGANDFADRDLDGQPDACDACPDDDPDDSDGDGVCDSDDACPGSDDTVDGDGDGVPDACDPCPEDALDDSDGDEICDSDDVCPGGNDGLDTDGDGIPNACDDCALGDSDGDGVADDCDVCPGSDDGEDTDGDGVADGCDACPLDHPNDTDGDGVCDTDDACPGADDTVDGDGDGVADACDACPLDNPDDSDGDGVCDADDVCPGSDDGADGDGDGVADGCDACPLDNPNDTDGDGVCDTDDACPGSDDTVDGDGDGVADGCDACPSDAPDDSDGDGSCDSDDICPGSDDTVDTDGDGVPDGCDPCPVDSPDDSDGDGVCDVDDVCLGDDATTDSDGDGVCDDQDPCPDDALDDSDGDGVCDSLDACPGSDDGSDGDGDGIADGCDPCPADAPDDTDLDGVCDSEDVCPGSDDTIDTDGDGIPNGCDACALADSDGDGVSDDCDVCPGSDDTADADGDTVPDACDVCPSDNPDDSDGDGVCDADDVCAGGNDGVDLDSDGVPDACDPCPADAPDDSDNDGVCDSDDLCEGSADQDDADLDGVPDGCDLCTGDDAQLDGDGDGWCGDVDPCDDWSNPDLRDCYRWYVDDDAVGANDGTSWADAFTTIDAALAASSRGDAIWVAVGRYPRTSPLSLPDDRELYGGFDATETDLAERANRFVETVITGDTNGDDIPYDLTSRDDNHDGPLVLSGDGTLLDGFRISGGRSTNLWGSAIRTRNGDTLTGVNLWLVDNVTSTRSTFQVNTGSSFHLSDSFVMQNSASSQPVGRFENDTTGSSLTNVVFADNRSGGLNVIWFEDQYVRLTGCTFDEPTVDTILGFGGQATSDYHLESSILYGVGDSLSSNGGPLVVTATCAQEDLSAWGTGNVDLDGSTAALGDPFAARYPSGERFLDPASACVDAGDGALLTAAGTPWSTLATELDTLADTTPADAGAHYDPFAVTIPTFENNAGTLVWSSKEATACTLDGVAVGSSGSTPVTGTWNELVCVGPRGSARAIYACEGDVASGDADGDGVCDDTDVCPGSDDRADADADGVPDACDVCPGSDDGADADSDGVADGCDLCADFYNPDQVTCYVWYVDDSATGAANGSSWTDAFTTIQAGINAASTGHEVWVAEGHYHSTTGGVNGKLINVSSKNVDVYGGFDGTETDRADRAGLFATTVLDGDVNGDDVYGDGSTRTDNARQIVTGGSGALVDGFLVRGGRDYNTAYHGAAVHCASGALEVSNLWIVDNHSDGTGLINTNGCNLTVSNVVMARNHVPYAVIRTGSGSVNTFRNITLLENTVTNTGSGTALWIEDGSNTTMSYVSIWGDHQAGLVRSVDTSTLLLRGAVLWNDGGPVLVSGSGTQTYEYVAAGESITGTANLYLDGSTAALDYPFDPASAQLFLDSGSAAVDAGDQANVATQLPGWDALTTQRDGTTDAAPVDLGAHYVPDGAPAITTSVAGGELSWTAAGSTECTVDGVVQTSPVPLTASAHEIVCRGPGGSSIAVHLCDGNPSTGDSDLDGVCDDVDTCVGLDTDDADADGVPDACDVCPGGDDTVDGDSDGVPDACDSCPLDALDDSDGDGSCDSADLCIGDDGTLDDDMDGYCADTDVCPGCDDTVDTDADGTADGCDVCDGWDDADDANGDGTPDGCDPCWNASLSDCVLDDDSAGPLRSIDELVPGELVFAEVIHEDVPYCGSAAAQFVELLYVGPGTVDLQGLVMSDGSGSHTVSVSIVLAHGDRAVLANSTGLFTGCYGFAPDDGTGMYINPNEVLTFSNATEVLVSADIDTSGPLWQRPNGSSMMLDDDLDLWCPTTTFNGANYASPGTPNGDCPTTVGSGVCLP